MKRIEEIINCKSICCKNKETSEELRELHYSINQILFRYIKKYAFFEYLESLENEITPLFISINNVRQLTWKQNLKREEILSIGRDILKRIKAAKQSFSYTLDKSIEDIIIKQLSYQLYQYHKMKDNMSIENKLLMLRENAVIARIILKYGLSPSAEIKNSTLCNKVCNFFKLQEQLAEQIKDEVDNIIRY